MRTSMRSASMSARPPAYSWIRLEGTGRDHEVPLVLQDPLREARLGPLEAADEGGEADGAVVAGEREGAVGERRPPFEREEGAPAVLARAQLGQA